MVEGVAHPLESRDYLEYGEVITDGIIYIWTLGSTRNCLLPWKNLLSPLPFLEKEWGRNLKRRRELFIPIKKFKNPCWGPRLENRDLSPTLGLAQHMLLSKLNSVGAIFISWPEAADVIHGIARRESVAKGPTGERGEALLPRRPSFPLPLSSPQKHAPSSSSPALRAMHAVVYLYARRLLDIYPNASPTPYPLPVTPSRVLIAWTSYNVASSSHGVYNTLGYLVYRD